MGPGHLGQPGPQTQVLRSHTIQSTLARNRVCTWSWTQRLAWVNSTGYSSHLPTTLRYASAWSSGDLGSCPGSAAWSISKSCGQRGCAELRVSRWFLKRGVSVAPRPSLPTTLLDLSRPWSSPRPCPGSVCPSQDTGMQPKALGQGGDGGAWLHRPFGLSADHAVTPTVVLLPSVPSTPEATAKKEFCTAPSTSHRIIIFSNLFAGLHN